MKKHTHRYQKEIFKKSGKVIFRCTIPGCTHYIFEQFALGRLSLCNRCDEPFELSLDSLVLRKPHCGNCSKPKAKKPSKGIEDLIGSLFGER